MLLMLEQDPDVWKENKTKTRVKYKQYCDNIILLKYSNSLNCLITTISYLISDCSCNFDIVIDKSIWGNCWSFN